MTEEIRGIVNAAIDRHACRRVLDIDSMESAISTLLSPEGREFAMRTGFPGLDTFRKCADEAGKVNVARVLVDAGRSVASECDCIAVGSTDLTLSVTGATTLTHVMVMHGARLKLDARNYAVVTVTVIDGTFDYTNDGTSYINIERR